jgi:hypothetical protein
MVAGFAEVIEREQTLVAEGRFELTAQGYLTALGVATQMVQ